MLLSLFFFYAALASASPFFLPPSIPPPPIKPAPPLAASSSFDISSAASSISSFMASPSFTPYSRPTEDVVEWIALGDSYTAGTGSNGNEEVIAGDAIRGKRAAPMQMKTDLDAWNYINANGGGVPPRFSFSAYTGDTTVELAVKQLKAGRYTATNADLPRHAFGAPQLAVMTIGGNDAYLSEIINNCLYNIWGWGDCDETLDKLQGELTDGTFKEKVGYALYETAHFGRQQGGANPRDSFQVYVTEYIPFFDESTTPCNDYTWAWWFRSGPKLTQSLRSRLNSLTRQVNSAIEQAANELERVGVIFVSGIADQYISGGHQFCATGHDNDKYMTDADTWFWSQYLPTGSDAESSSVDSTTDAVFNSTMKQSLLDFVYGKGNITVEAYPSSPLIKAQASTQYKTFYDLMTAMANSPEKEYQWLSLETIRSMHPKGTAYGVHKDAIMEAIANNRGSVAASHTSTATPPDASATATQAPSSEPPPGEAECNDCLARLKMEE